MADVVLEADAIARRAEDDVASLRDEVARERPDLLPLDLSYASIDRLEGYYRAALEAGTSSDVLDGRVASYLGATLAASTGGRWIPPRQASDRNRPGITRLPRLARARFDPLAAVYAFARLRTAGSLRDATERYDVSARRAHLAQLLAGQDAAFDLLRAEVRELVGRDPGNLDGSRESVEAVEEALRRLAMPGTPIERMRRFRDAATLYLGQIAQRAVGGEWGITEDPRDFDLGSLEMDGWSPISTIRVVGADDSLGQLQAALDAAIAGRRR
jgi:hypothetical protein